MKQLLLAAALTAASATTVAASSFTVDYQGSGAFGTPNWSERVDIDSSGFDGRVRAGLFRLTGSNGVGDFVAFCADLAQSMAGGKTYHENSSLFGAPTLGQIEKLFSTAWASVSSSVTAAGFQIALWEILEDSSGSYDLGAGAFKATAVTGDAGSIAAVSQAQSYLSGLNGPATGDYLLTFYESGDSQDLVTAEAVAPVPLPAPVFMLIAGLGGLAAFGRRRKAA